MAKKKGKRPIDLFRDSAGSMEIESVDDPSPITNMITFDNRLLIVKSGGIYEVQLADQVDPKRKNPQTPNSYKRLIRHGSDSEFLSRTFLMSDILIDETYLRSGLSRDTLMPVMLALALNLGQINELINDYKVRESAAIEALAFSNKQLEKTGTFEVPLVPNVESTCKSFLILAKHAMQDLLDLAGKFYGSELRRGYFSDLQDLAKEKYGENDSLFQFMKETENFREFVRAARNCLEHPKPDKQVIVSNTKLNEAGKLVLPSIQVVHPKYALEEVELSYAMQEIFSELIQFSEMYIAALVGKNITKQRSGLEFQLVYFPDGHRSNPKIKYGFGVVLEGKLRPMG